MSFLAVLLGRMPPDGLALNRTALMHQPLARTFPQRFTWASERSLSSATLGGQPLEGFCRADDGVGVLLA